VMKPYLKAGKALSLAWLAREGERVLRPKRRTAGPMAQALYPRLYTLCMAYLGMVGAPVPGNKIERCLQSY